MRGRVRIALVGGLLLSGCSGDAATTPVASVPLSTVAEPSPTTSEPAPVTTPVATGNEPSTSAARPETTAAPTPSQRTVPVIRPDAIALGAPSTGWSEPVDLDAHPVSGELYVTERTGTVRRVEQGPDASPVIDVSERISQGGERGLLGLAFAADGQSVYLNLTDLDGDTEILEFALTPEGDLDATAARLVAAFDQPYSNHNGGEILLGPDGALWVPTGDGGSGGDPRRLALDPDSPLGKLLRIDVSGEDAVVEIWAAGLRNPWRASFDEATGDLWIADVGQGDVEEISVARAEESWAHRRHFGWSAFEGTRRFNTDQPVEGHVPPVFEYRHGDEGCSISGGIRYRGEALGDLWGAYLFSDYCSGRVRALPVDEIGNVVGPPVDLGVVASSVAVRADANGEPWIVSIRGDLVPLVSRD